MEPKLIRKTFEVRFFAHFNWVGICRVTRPWRKMFWYKKSLRVKGGKRDICVFSRQLGFDLNLHFFLLNRPLTSTHFHSPTRLFKYLNMSSGILVSSPQDVFLYPPKVPSFPVSAHKRNYFWNPLKEIFAPIGPDDTRVSVIQFASTIRHEITFNTGQNQSDVNRRVSQIQFAEGGTMVGLALKQLRTHIFSANAGARRNAS